VSARSALTEGSDRDSFCSHSSQKVQLGTGAVQGVRRPGKSLRVANLSEVLKDCCCRCAQSRRLQHLDVLKVCRKECVQEFSEGLEVVGKAQEG
jgi:hypothetical protein